MLRERERERERKGYVTPNIVEATTGKKKKKKAG